jgi:hypothetical protein
VIEFPGERRVTLIGHNHGDREVPHRLSRWAAQPLDAMTTDAWLSELEGLLAENAKAREHAKQDLAFLRSTLWTSETPIFVAVESMEGAVATAVGQAETFTGDLNRQICQRPPGDTAPLRDAELLFMGAAVFSYLHDPELRPKYELLGIETDKEAVDLQARGKKTMRLAEDRLGTLMASREVDEDALKKYMQRVVDLLNEGYKDIGNILVYDHTVIRERLENWAEEDKDVRGAVYSYLFGYLDFLRGMKRRDVAIMRALASQERPGVLFIGEEHLDSLIPLVEMQCGRPLPAEGELKEPDVLKQIPEL